MNIPFTKHTLDNGMDILVHEDRGCPIVAVNVWYHVGSKNERPGLTGFAHLFEHLMFEGSEHCDRGYFHPLQDAGAQLNGSTNVDRTDYWEVVPTGALDLALWMESDRMGYLLPALTQTKFDTQREVVLNERRQNYENRPYGMSGLAIVAALYPPGHPYHWPTIGMPKDLHAATLDDARAFFAAHYHPANASLALAGDVDTDKALAIAQRYFEEIAPGPLSEAVAPGDIESHVESEVRLVLEDRVELSRLYLAWHTPAMFAPGDAELDLLADMLANGKTSRLYRTLVYERRIAVDVAASQNSRELSSFFHVIATAAPGHSLAEIECEITSEIARIAVSAGADELVRSQAQAEAQFVYRLQTVGGFGGKSDQLNAYNVYVNDPGYFETDLARYRDVSSADVQAVAARYLRPDKRVTLSVVPRGRGHEAIAGSSPAAVS